MTGKLPKAEGDVEIGFNVDGIHVSPTSVLAQKIATPERGDCPYTIFLGAGASISSGIKSAGSLVNDWKKSLYDEALKNNKAKKTYKKWVKKEFPKWRRQREKDAKIDPDESEYGALFSYFVAQPAERQTYIEKLIKDARPAFGYLYLAGLVNDKRFNKVLTTNFDDLLNDALIHYYEARPVVYSFDSSVAGARMAGKRPKIIKLHGDYLYDNLKNVRNEVHALESNMEQKLYEACKDSGLVVAGYSGSDESIMAPLRDMLRKPGYLTFGLHWCLYVDPETGLPQIGDEIKRLAISYRGDVHFYVMPSFDETMEMMFRSCQCPLPHALTRPHERSLPKRFYESVVQGSSNKLTTGMHTDLHEIMTRAGKPIDEDEYKVLDAELSWKWGEIARDNVDFLEARERFNEGFAKLQPLLHMDYEKSGEFGTPNENFSKHGSPNAIMLAIRRYAGLQVAMAKLDEILWDNDKGKTSYKNNALKQLEKVIKVVENGAETMSSLDAKEIGRHGVGVPSLTSPLRRSIYYNGVCALGVKMRISNKLTKRDISLISDWEEKLRAYDNDGSHFAKLRRDADYEPLISKNIRR